MESVEIPSFSNRTPTPRSLSFLTLALQNGVDVKTVSGMLGHYSAGFTLDTYAHVTTSAQRQAAEAMEHVLSGSL